MATCIGSQETPRLVVSFILVSDDFSIFPDVLILVGIISFSECPAIFNAFPIFRYFAFNVHIRFLFFVNLIIQVKIWV